MTTCYHCHQEVEGLSGHAEDCPVPALILLVIEDDEVVIVEELLKVIDELMPGLRHIAVEDYALLNEAPIRARAWLGRRKGEQVGRRLRDGTPVASITCPKCGAVSYHPKDISERYCGRCHQFHEFMGRE